MATTVVRPAACEDVHLDYLDGLRESGHVNMFGARAFLMEDFGSLSKDEARAVLLYWMATFEQRANAGATSGKVGLYLTIREDGA